MKSGHREVWGKKRNKEKENKNARTLVCRHLSILADSLGFHITDTEEIHYWKNKFQGHASDTTN